jgi:hypothetical protein
MAVASVLEKTLLQYLKKTAIESMTVFLVGGLPSVSSVPSLLDRKIP